MISRFLSRIAAGFFLLGPWSPVARAGDSTADLERVLTAHRAARESIRTVQANYKVETILPKAETYGAGKFLRTPDGTLFRTGKEGETASDILIGGGQTRLVGRTWNKGKIQYTASLMTGTQSLGLMDMWQRLLLSNYGPDLQTMPLEQYIETATKGPAFDEKRRDGRPLAIVTFTIGTGREAMEHRAELDSNVNYLVRKHTISPPSRNSRSEAEIVEFIEPQPGVFVPVKCRMRHYKGDEIDQEMMYSLSDAVVNADVPKERLKLPTIPSGTLLSNRIEEKRYPVDESWRQIGPAQPAPTLKLGDPAKISTEFTTQSVGEPRSWSSWIISISAGLFAVSAVAWLFLRWRRSSVSAPPNADSQP
jgi:hypothetical protein